MTPLSAGTISEEEFTAGFGMYSPIEKQVDFSDLMAADGPCEIPDTALRAMDLDKLERIIDHVRRRLESEVWYGWGGVELTPKTVTLYDACNYVILPATLSAKWSMVEMMSSHEQPPDYFVSQ